MSYQRHLISATELLLGNKNKITGWIIRLRKLTKSRLGGQGAENTGENPEWSIFCFLNLLSLLKPG